MIGVYIHIPFCKTICSYCDFCKMFYNQKWSSSYLDSLEKEIDSLKAQQIELEAKESAGTINGIERIQLLEIRTDLAEKETTLELRKQELANLQEQQDAYSEALEDLDEQEQDAYQQIEDGRKEIADGRKEIADGKAELEKNKQDLETGRKELEDAQKEFDDAKQEVHAHFGPFLFFIVYNLQGIPR